MKKILILFFIILLSLNPAYGHKLISHDDSHTNFELSLKIPDHKVSWAIYENLGENEAKFYTFEAIKGDSFFASIVVPKIVGLEEYSPTLVLVGDDNFEKKKINYEKNFPGDEFYEPFGQINYWERQELKIEIPVDGTYFLVVMDKKNLMKTTITAISTIALLLVVTSTVSSAYAEVPDWVKNNAGWWADGTITDAEFVNGIQHLIKMGIVNIPNSDDVSLQLESDISSDSELVVLQDNLNNCAEINKAYDRLNCERDAKFEITSYGIKNSSQTYVVGPVTYYWTGLGTEGNTFEITSSGQALLNLRILVENTGSDQNESLFCTGPAICNYDITDGDSVYKYSQMDFTNGAVVLKPGESKIFNMMFGPNIGGGGTTFEYDSGNEYQFRINETFGSTNIPLKLE